jgi:hypothetical protein
VALRQELDLVNPAELKDEVENFLTHRILESLKADSDGIIPLDEISVGPTPNPSQEGKIKIRYWKQASSPPWRGEGWVPDLGFPDPPANPLWAKT